MSKINFDNSKDTYKEYLERKKRFRELHKRLKETKKNQEIFHKIIGAVEETESTKDINDDFL